MRTKTRKKISLYIMAAFYVAAGINHFVNTDWYMQIMPGWLVAQLQIVYITGIFEIVFGILLVPHATRRNAAWCIIIFLIVVFPANIQMAINYWNENNPSLWLAILRLPLQFVLIWWAYLFTKRLN